VIDAPVQIAEVRPAVAVKPSTGLFAVQVGSFADRRNADRVQSVMEQRYGSAKLVLRDSQPPQWRVLVGHEASEEDAEALAVRIRSDPDAGSAGAFVVRLDPERVADSL
jgi:cell division protein FtsN